MFIYQDADDIPHPQRIEIIKRFFENHDIVHLNHFWIPSGVKFRVEYDVDSIGFTESKDIFNFYFPHNYFDECLYLGGYGGFVGPTHAGLVAVKKGVLDVVRWKDWSELQVGMPAEDYCFCLETLWNFNKSMIIHADLNVYTNPDAEKMYRNR